MTGSLARGLVIGRNAWGWWVPNRGLFRTEAFRRASSLLPTATNSAAATAITMNPWTPSASPLPATAISSLLFKHPQAWFL